MLYCRKEMVERDGTVFLEVGHPFATFTLFLAAVYTAQPRSRNTQTERGENVKESTESYAVIIIIIIIILKENIFSTNKIQRSQL